jgi:hypothetical protein
MDQTKTYMNIGNYLDKPVRVKKKENVNYDEMDYIYFDVRIGCDLCNKGAAFGMEMNYVKLRKKDSFLLNDVCILKKDWYYSIQALYVCKDNSYYKELSELYKHIGDNKCIDDYVYDDDKNLYENSHAGLTSCFDQFDDSNEDNIAQICASCLVWFNFIKSDDKTIMDKFEHVHPLNIFWKNSLTEYILDDIEFINKEDKKYIENIFEI